MSVKIAGIEFGNVSYYREGDILYLWVGETREAADFDESPEGHYLRYDEEGALSGITIVNACRILERDGKDRDHAAGAARRGDGFGRRSGRVATQRFTSC